MILVLFHLCYISGPMENSISRRIFYCHKQIFLSIWCIQLERCIFNGMDSLFVSSILRQYLFIQPILVYRKKIIISRSTVPYPVNRIVMISCSGNIWDLTIQTTKHLSSKLPLSFGALITIMPRIDQVILLNQIAYTDYHFNIKRIYIIFDPTHHQIKNWLVSIPFDIILNVRNQDHTP